jgi:ribosomal protein S18 acetylase RimI-like enzyme
MFIRPARSGDREALYDVCLRTGLSGQDATALYDDPLLLGEVYVGPYLAVEPDLAFVLDDEGDVVGYVLGARDTAAFERRCELEWWPALRARYPAPPPGRPWTPDEHLHQLIHHPPRTEPSVLVDHPAHLHLDLLPQAQGSGYGGRLIGHLIDRLRELSVRGVHLGVDARNERAIGFYRRVGLHTLRETDDALVMGMALTF